MNWDKPLSKEDFYDKSAQEACEYHGKKNWDDLVSTIVGAKNRSSGYKLYEVYLEYCKLMSSPLGKALS